ncbi:MAG: AmmeMemoRadiSam system radical SAM enzyme [Smithellaceae bacterium]|nr:AmmeMemoRadiSam system radical SAM enzyme [Smithellaceae bacterium]
MIHEAMLYEKLEDGRVECKLCAHRCRINDGRRGICHVRENQGGTLQSLVYGAIIAQNVDPIEKKPLFHVYPGSKSFSIATPGCNFRCLFCQNHEISQMPRETGETTGREASPSHIVNQALAAGCKTIAFTYTEPTIYFEYAYDIMKIAHDKGLKNVFVTNGFMTGEAIGEMTGLLDAANVDLKSFSDEFYKKTCGARLQPVLDSLRNMKDAGIWIEVTTLVVPGLNDSTEEFEKIASFVASIGIDTPWHVSRFHPQYKLNDRPATPLSTIQQAVDAGKSAGLKYIYSGNVPGDEAEHTLCAHCGERLIRRFGFQIDQLNLRERKCPRCGTELEGIF